ncbi:hypothetical protein ACQKWADRAFT_303426 [Trichoderma austrokoningii]
MNGWPRRRDGRSAAARRDEARTNETKGTPLASVVEDSRWHKTRYTAPVLAAGLTAPFPAPARHRSVTQKRPAILAQRPDRQRWNHRCNSQGAPQVGVRRGAERARFSWWVALVRACVRACRYMAGYISAYTPNLRFCRYNHLSQTALFRASERGHGIRSACIYGHTYIQYKYASAVPPLLATIRKRMQLQSNASYSSKSSPLSEAPHRLISNVLSGVRG